MIDSVKHNMTELSINEMQEVCAGDILFVLTGVGTGILVGAAIAVSGFFGGRLLGRN